MSIGQTAPGARRLARALCAALIGSLMILTSLPASAVPFTARGGSAAPPVANEPATVVKLEGDNQTTLPGQTFPEPLVVRVEDSAGNPVEGALVTFAVTSGSASLSSTGPVATNVRGGATTMLTAGNITGRVTVLASVPGTPGAIFTVSVAADAPAPRADLAVRITGPRAARARSTVRYTVSVRNRGPSAARNVAVVFAAPGIRIHGAAWTSRIGRTSARGACWTIGVLPAGRTVRDTFTGRVVAGPGRLLVVLAGAVARGSADPVGGNNVAIAYLRVR